MSEKVLTTQRADEEDKKSEETNLANHQISLADELKKLSDLRDSGVLTEEEFLIQKQKLINPKEQTNEKRY